MDDLIRRNDAIELAYKLVEDLSETSLEWNALKYWAKEKFMDLPSAQKTGEWINCNDRLPREFEGKILICTKHNEVAMGEYDTHFRCWYTSDRGVDFEELPFEDVTHWMPLPQPPKK